MTDHLPIPDALRNMAFLAERADHAEFLRRVADGWETYEAGVKWMRLYPEYKPNPDFSDEWVPDIRRARDLYEAEIALRAPAPASEPKKDRDDG